MRPNVVGWRLLFPCCISPTMRHLTNQLNDVYQYPAKTAYNWPIYKMDIPMVFLNRIPHKISVLSFVALIFISSGCSTIVEKKAKEFDPSKINNILFEFDHSPEFLGSALPKVEISTQIANNLAEWGYKIKADKAIDYDHVLSIEIGEIQRASTPAGFSFSMGNSDPRAVDFQKADVLPMSCYLTEKDQSEKSAELDATVTADDYLPYIKQGSTDQKLNNILVNDISTICFNLLSNLKINTEPYEKNVYSTKPGWFPDIRVEVVNDAEAETMYQSPEMEVVNEATSENADHSPSIEKNQNKKAPRKRIIIHNQGSPITIKFGHERK